MKRLVPVLVLLFAASLVADVVKRGAPLSDAKPTLLADVIARPEAFKDKPVIIEGVVAAACTEKGCWMELAPAASMPSIHVKMKGYAFFVPTDSKGLKARAEGVASVESLSKEEADHQTKEGAVLTRNADGTARQVTFVATGVELQK